MWSGFPASGPCRLIDCTDCAMVPFFGGQTPSSSFSDVSRARHVPAVALAGVTQFFSTPPSRELERNQGGPSHQLHSWAPKTDAQRSLNPKGRQRGVGQFFAHIDRGSCSDVEDFMGFPFRKMVRKSPFRSSDRVFSSRPRFPAPCLTPCTRPWRTAWGRSPGS